MSIQLVGRNNAVADVSEDGLQLVESLDLSPQAYHNRKGSGAYWNSTYSATGGEEVIYIKNDDPRNLYITKLWISSAVASLYTLFRVTSGTAAGTAITPVNAMLGGGTPGLESSFGNASVTGSLSGTTLVVGSIGVALVDDGVNRLDGLVVPETEAIAITLTTTGAFQAHIEGYWA